MQSYQRFQCIGHTDFNTSGTNASHLLPLTKVGTHSAFRERSHTAAHTAKQGAFRMGALSLPPDRFARFGNPAWPGLKRQTLPLLNLGRMYSRRTQKAFGTAMRSCASLFRGVAAPLGCGNLFFCYSVVIFAPLPVWSTTGIINQDYQTSQRPLQNRVYSATIF